MRLAALALAALVSACAAAPEGPRMAAPASQARGLTPDQGGLQPAGTALRIDFGRAQEGTVAAVSKLLGAGPVASSRRPDCRGAETEVAWASGLTLAFRTGTFVGWRDAEGRSAGTICPPV